MVKHPAPYSDNIIKAIQSALDRLLMCGRVLDPMAGSGRVHELSGYETYGVELEPEWAQMHPRTQVGDATALRFDDFSFEAIVVSPCYGNRMADHHDARDNSYRRTYTHVLGRKLSDNNAGAMQWGEEYRDLHRKAWAEAVRVLRPCGLFLLNCKDHTRAGKRMHVTNWHYKTLLDLGLNLVEVSRIDTPHFRYGENREYRHPERLLVFSRTAQEERDPDR